MNTIQTIAKPISSEDADALFLATGLSHLCENVEYSQPDENNDGCWTYELETGETLCVLDDSTVIRYDTDGIGRIYSAEDLRA